MIDFSIEIARQAAERWQKRQKKRSSDAEKMKKGALTEVETPERIALNLERLTKAVVRGETAPRADVFTAVVDEETPKTKAVILKDISAERIIGEPDFLGADFLERGLAVARFVGRVNIRSGSGATVGYGTGFMVSPRLLLTNNHVLENKQTARFSQIEFDYQRDRRGQMLPVAAFALEPDTFFMTDEDLDYTLVAVGNKSFNNRRLELYGWNSLIGELGKILISQPVNIVQHPRGEIKQIVLRKNELLDLLDTFAHYAADTEPGSSGAPVFSDMWEVVALHHSGVPETDANGNILTVDGTVFKKGMNPDRIHWIANEGIRVSSLVGDIREKMQSLSGLAKDLCAELLEKAAPNPLEIKEMAEREDKGSAMVAVSEKPAGDATAVSSPVSGSHTEATWTIPLRINVTIGAPQPGSGSQNTGGQVLTVLSGGDPSGDSSTTVTEEAISIDPNYNNRQGYRADFLGSGSGKRVQLPQLSPRQQAIAAINRQANNSGGSHYELPYHHFSIVMNRERRLAFFTAVNIDGNRDFGIRREKDRWFYDPRIGKNEQIGEDLYKSNPLDRGHLVRRLDPAWGDNQQIAKVANDDTFHFTNCSPQHEGFNQSKLLWAGLEDYLLNNANKKNFRASVFTGPVFADDDPEYRGYRLPKQFWKVAVMVKQNGKLSATAYLLSQEKLLDNLEAEFVFGKYRTYQVSVEAVEELTGLDFGNLKDFQPKTLESLSLTEAVADRELTSFDQIKI